MSFGGEKINPSYEIIKRIKDNIGGAEIIKLEVPVVFHKSAETVIKKINEINPDYVIMLGQAGGRHEISIERVAINIDDASIPDNENNRPIDEAIDKEGLPAYFSTLPVKRIIRVLREMGIPASLSNSAGTYVCNHLMYSILNYIYSNKLNIKAGFIHIPYIMEQVVNKPGTPSMTLEALIQGIETAIKAAMRDSDDIKVSEGKIC
ncbi:pyrrolidone-carboxylate peptidase [Fervidicella metallireducens AeB]|uniref:Pyroglutamyl-peptidase I n=1 Tax=Fervidicella metallireducens AeB TaxID=1403537 RepID=A0A017RRF7_9CLOT|nr:pyrrolidone-carboxylate peptidase [Fervidicella metallireducens AeB]